MRQSKTLSSLKGKKPSSKKWLQRQAKDPFVTQAKKEGYRARAAYKLLQIDKKFHLIEPGMTIIDLGAAPGSWLQVIQRKLAMTPSNKPSTIIGVDLLPIDPLQGATCIEGDFTDPAIQEQLQSLAHQPIDLVLSDMAPATSGHARMDHLRIIELAETALDFALQHLRLGGHFVTKLFQGAEEQKFFNDLKPYFTTVKRFKPSASRQESAEFYIVAMGLKDQES